MKQSKNCEMPILEIDKQGDGLSRVCQLVDNENQQQMSFENEIAEMTKVILSRLNVDEKEARLLAIENLLETPVWAHLKSVYISELQMSGLN